MFNFTSKIILSPKLQDLKKLQWLLHLRKTGCRPEANRKCGINDDVQTGFSVTFYYHEEDLQLTSLINNNYLIVLN